MKVGGMMLLSGISCLVGIILEDATMIFGIGIVFTILGFFRAIGLGVRINDCEMGPVNTISNFVLIVLESAAGIYLMCVGN